MTKLFEGFAKLTKSFQRKTPWMIGYQFAQDFRQTRFYSSKYIPNPKGRFLADPFIWVQDSRHYVFCEDYDYRMGKGSISVFKISRESKPEFLGKAIEEDFHLSFPYLFQYQGELYMVPEATKSESIRIYKCEKFPLEWSLQEVVMTGVRAADTVIFQKGDSWILLTTLSASGGRELRSELYAFSSRAPVGAEWRPIGDGPILFDSLKGRNGGLFYHDEKIFRVAQRQAYDSYGASLTIFELVGLDSNGLEERRVAEIGPHFSKNAIGLHSLDNKEGLSVFDILGRNK